MRDPARSRPRRFAGSGLPPAVTPLRVATDDRAGEHSRRGPPKAGRGAIPASADTGIRHRPARSGGGAVDRVRVLCGLLSWRVSWHDFFPEGSRRPVPDGEDSVRHKRHPPGTGSSARPPRRTPSEYLSPVLRSGVATLVDAGSAAPADPIDQPPEGRPFSGPPEADQRHLTRVDAGAGETAEATQRHTTRDRTGKADGRRARSRMRGRPKRLDIDTNWSV